GNQVHWCPAARCQASRSADTTPFCREELTMLRLILTLAVAVGGVWALADADAPRDARKELQGIQGKWRERGSIFTDTRVLRRYLPDYEEALKSVRIEGTRFRVGTKGQSFVMANDLSMMTELKPPNLYHKHELIGNETVATSLENPLTSLAAALRPPFS